MIYVEWLLKIQKYMSLNNCRKVLILALQLPWRIRLRPVGGSSAPRRPGDRRGAEAEKKTHQARACETC